MTPTIRPGCTAQQHPRSNARGANDLGILALTQGSEYQGLPAQSRSHDPGVPLVKGNELE